MRLLGIDYGSKRIGLAITDPSGFFPAPYDVIENNKQSISKIKKICKDREIGKIIIGQSLNYEGQENIIAKKISEFADKLFEEIELPIDWEREILTTKETERFFGRDKLNDARAAALILKSYIDSHK